MNTKNQVSMTTAIRELQEAGVAERHMGYQVGGTSPFGTRKKIPTYIEMSILDLEMIFINGGKRGYLVSLSPQESKGNTL